MTDPGDRPPPSSPDDEPPGQSPPPGASESPPAAYGQPYEPEDDGGDDAPGNPWERRDEVGFVAGLAGAIKGFLLNPAGTYGVSRRTGDLLSPLLFAALFGVFGTACDQLWGVAMRGTALQQIEQVRSMAPPEMLPLLEMVEDSLKASPVLSVVISLVIAPFWTVLKVFLLGGLIHVALMLLGGDEDSEAGFEGSVRAVSYGLVAEVARMIPMAGGLIAWLWMLVLTVIGLVKLHDTGEGRAIGAVFLVFGFCCACVCGGVGAFTALAMALAGAGG